MSRTKFSIFSTARREISYQHGALFKQQTYLDFESLQRQRMELQTLDNVVLPLNTASSASAKPTVDSIWIPVLAKPAKIIKMDIHSFLLVNNEKGQSAEASIVCGKQVDK